MQKHLLNLTVQYQLKVKYLFNLGIVIRQATFGYKQSSKNAYMLMIYIIDILFLIYVGRYLFLKSICMIYLLLILVRVLILLDC